MALDFGIYRGFCHSIKYYYNFLSNLIFVSVKNQLGLSAKFNENKSDFKSKE